MASPLPSSIRGSNQLRGEVRWGVVAMIEKGFVREEIIEYIDENLPRNSRHEDNNWGLRTELDYVLANPDRTFRWYVEAGGGRSDLLEESIIGDVSHKTNIDVTVRLKNKIGKLQCYLPDDVIAYRREGEGVIWGGNGWNQFDEQSVAELMRRYHPSQVSHDTSLLEDSYQIWVDTGSRELINEIANRLNIQGTTRQFDLPIPNYNESDFDYSEGFIFGVEIMAVSSAERLDIISLGHPEFFMEMDLYCRSVVTNERTSIISDLRFFRGNWVRLGRIDTNQDCFSFRHDVSENHDPEIERLGGISEELIDQVCHDLDEQTNCVFLGVALGWNEQYHDRFRGEIAENFEIEFFRNPNLPSWYPNDPGDYFELFD